MHRVKTSIALAAVLALTAGGTAEDDRVVFEFRDSGELRGQPYRNLVAISLDVRGEKISGYREYFGLVGPPPEAADE